MEFAKFIDNKGWGYSFQSSSNIGMCILGGFLSSDVSWHRIQTYKEWGLHPDAEFISGNITCLEKVGNYIYLSDLYPEEGYDGKLKVSLEQFVKILDDWEQICKLKPSQVTIKYENDEFIFETR